MNESDMEQWSCCDGVIVLNILPEDSEHASHFGDCELDAIPLMQKPYIAEQVAQWDRRALADSLRGLGWSDAELRDHERNILCWLWLTGGDFEETTPCKESQ